MDWGNGVALLISDQPIQVEGSFTEIPNSGLHKITGSNGWQCIEVIQEFDVVYCGYDCDGYFEYYPGRMGCQYVGSGYCAHSSYIRKVESECVEDRYGNCTLSGEYTDYYMWACN